jgi:hypothetical protein
MNWASLGTAREYLHFIVEMDAFNAALTEDKYLLGIEFEYTPRYGKGTVPKRARVWEAD